VLTFRFVFTISFSLWDTNGQGVSRHPLPTLLCFNFFPTAQTAHLVLPHPQADLSGKSKEPFLTFKNIDDILHKDAGCGSELDYVERPLGFCSSNIWTTWY
jgi:hypothetical protein